MQAIILDILRNVFSTVDVVHEVSKEGKGSLTKHFKLHLEYNVSWQKS